MSVQIKVCGMRNRDNIQALLELPVDFIGFIFYDASKRYIDPTIREYIASLDAVEKIGVFVNAEISTIRKKIEQYRLTGVQLHGQETAAYCAELKQTNDITVIKAFGIDQSFDWNKVSPYAGISDYLLFDTKSPAYGGSGEQFDWDLLNRYQGTVPYFLSGGLDENNIEQALHSLDSRMFALDLNSRFEVEPGFKNIDLLTKTLNKIKQ